MCLATEFYSGFLGSCSFFNHNLEESASLLQIWSAWALTILDGSYI